MAFNSTNSRTRAGVLVASCLAAGVLSLTTAACSGPTMAGEDTGKSKEDSKPPAKRSYENPNMPMTEAEFKEIDSFCEATMLCHKRRCDAAEIQKTFKAVKVSTSWGKKLQDHFAAEKIDRIGWRLGQLVDQEDLHHKSMACRRVRARFD